MMKNYSKYSNIHIKFIAGIVKALRKLWKKIEHLEQIRISERKSSSKEVLARSKNEDLTITDVQYKLLVLQLQYIRSILRQKLDKSSIISQRIILEDFQTSHDRNDPRNIELKDFQIKTISQETQTGSSLIEGWNEQSYFPVPTNIKRIDAQVSTDSQVLRPEGPSDCSASFTAKLAQNSSKPSSKPHYHLKLDDVPFILGASSTASHSVVANVQNIIAMMKSHNKALCGSKQHVSRQSGANTHSTGDSQDATKMLNELSQDLYELALKQEKLAKKFDAAQGKKQASNISTNFEADDVKGNKPIPFPNMQKNIPANSVERHQSHSEPSVKLHAAVKNSSIKEKDIKCSVQQKQNLANIRGQSSNPPIMARRKLLRSLQNFKTHLSEEDISWE